MIINTRALLTLICVALFGFSLAAAEDLHIVKEDALSINDIVAQEGVKVYAVLEDELLVGATPTGVNALAQAGCTIQNLGPRIDESNYFLFQIDAADIGKLSADITIIYFDGQEAIGVTPTELDASSIAYMRRLTRISFVPKPQVGQKANIPTYDMLTDPQIEAIVNQVSQVQYTAFIQRMQDFVTRYSYTDSCRAAEQWAKNTMAAMGLQTELFAFSYGGNTWHDPIGRKMGTVYPDSLYIIIGHLDATSSSPNTSAPGAEDNGSGSACVLEAARVLSQYDFDCTIEFVLVTGEEQGLIGSEAYAQYCNNNNRRIGGGLNFDMISYTGTYGWDTNIYADQNAPAELALADLLALLTNDYSTAYSVRVNTSGPFYGSDHYYFSLYGYPAPFSIDAQLQSAPDWYPWYHTTSDLISHLNLPFGTEVVKGGVATMATLAHLSIPPVLLFNYPNGLPQLINPNGGTTFRVEVTAGTSQPQPGTGLLYYSTGGNYTNIPMQVVAPNIYDAVFPPITCGSDVFFYVSARTMDNTIVTDPVAAPTAHYSAFVASGLTSIYLDDFSTNQGWTGLGGSGEWTIGAAVGGAGNDGYGGPDPAVDHSPTSDNKVLGNDLTSGSGGDYAANLSTTYYVTSPTINCTGYIGVTLNFYRWLGVEGNTYDHAGLQAYNGTTWITVFENGSGTIDESSWNLKAYDISAIADNNANLKLRFGIGSSDVAWQYCGWNIDDLEVIGYYCASGPAVSVDMIPNNPPINVPAGGSFSFTGVLTNNQASPTTTDVWVMVNVPNYGLFGPTMQANNVPLAANQILTYPGIQQFVPVYAPPGSYGYIAYCGDYPAVKIDSASFAFTVTAAIAGGADSWTLSGWFEQGENSPYKTELFGNYPNPFNAETSFSYSLAKDADVKLEIYNLMGQKVATVIDQRQDAGYKTIQWDASQYSSGIYFYKLRAGDQVFARRLTLLK